MLLPIFSTPFHKKTECVVKTHDRSETFVLQGNIVIIHQSLLNSIFASKLYILMKKINYCILNLVIGRKILLHIMRD
jgi:hypothetical protein